MVIRSVHRLLSILLTWPAQVHVSSSDLFNHVCDFCLLPYPGVILSRYVMFSIIVCAAASLFFAWMVNAHVSAPCVIAGNTREL